MLSEQRMHQKSGLAIQGSRVCQRAFRPILGIGKHRFGRLRSAAIRQEPCPNDMRFRAKAYETLRPNSVRPQIVEFLQELYHTTAEPLPEAYSVPAEQAEGQGISPGPQNVRRRGKRPRHLFKFDKESKGHTQGAKFLPPGTLVEYLQLCRSQLNLPIGRKIFCREPLLSL